jgi:hypothetical protein
MARAQRQGVLKTVEQARLPRDARCGGAHLLREEPGRALDNSAQVGAGQSELQLQRPPSQRCRRQ